MIIEQHEDHISILKGDMAVTVPNNARLQYKDNNLMVFVEGSLELTFNNVHISEIMSDITIEL